MVNSSVPNVRFVRCPKCSEILPEPANVPFYRCGGCETILQAKHYKKPNEVSKPVSESSSSVQNNDVQECVHGGEASSSNLPVMDQNEGLNPSSTQNENLEQPGVGISNSSREASSPSQPNQQARSSSQHSLDLDEETDQSLEVTNLLRKGSSLNEPSPPNCVVAPNLVSETGEVEWDPRYTERHGDSRASSSDESVEQLPPTTPENIEVRQDEIVVEERLEAADSSSEAASPEATTANTYWDAHELNQNVSVNCRLEQPGASSFSNEALLSNERGLHDTNNSSSVGSEEGQIDRSSTMMNEHLKVSNSSGEPTPSIAPIIGGDELSSKIGLPKEDVLTTEKHFVANPWERLPESTGFRCEAEISSPNEPFSNREEADNVDDICGRDENMYSHTVISSNQCTPLENKELSQLVTEIEEMDGGRTVQNESGISNEDLAIDNLPGKKKSSAEVSSKMTDRSAFVLPEAENVSDSNLSSKSEVSNAPYEKGNTEPQNSVEGDASTDGNYRDVALLTLKATKGAEVLNLGDRSLKTVDKNPLEQIEELQKAAPDGFESAETAEAIDAHIKVPEVGTSDKGLPKSPARSSLAYDGSVSSCDGTDDQAKYKIPSETTQGINKPESPTALDQVQYLPKRSIPYGDRQAASVGEDLDCAFKSPTDLDRTQYLPKRNIPYGDRQAASVGEDLDCDFEEQRTPVMLNEIKIPEVLSDSPYRSTRTRPRTQVQRYRRSPDSRYESSDHLVHKDFYDHPVYYLPYRYRDVESRAAGRHLHRSDMDGRMISEAVWMGEEFHRHPYHESSGEMYPHPRHQMYYHGRRQAEYQPPVHRMARVPYSGETVRSGYRVLDSYSHHYSGEMRWSSHLPLPPGLSYNRRWNGPKEPFDSYNASPQVFTDSDYYAWGHDSISEDQRHSGQRTSRVQVRRNSQPVQHFQPIGGAAPFITCYQCSMLLQLPSDFLLFKGMRIHRVKCSACSNILKFTLEKGRHLVPYVPKPVAPLREYPVKGDADKFLKSASTSQSTHVYEASYRRSASNSIYAGSSQDQNAERASLRSSSQASERQRSKFESNHSQDKGKSIMVEMHKHNSAAGSSPPDILRQPKVTWKVPDRSSSPLHRLMGYSSPSAVLHGYGSSDDLEIHQYSRN